MVLEHQAHMTNLLTRTGWEFPGSPRYEGHVDARAVPRAGGQWAGT